MMINEWMTARNTGIMAGRCGGVRTEEMGRNNPGKRQENKRKKDKNNLQKKQKFCLQNGALVIKYFLV